MSDAMVWDQRVAWHRALHETVADVGSLLGAGVARAAGVVGEYFEPRAVKLGDPPVQHKKPHRVLAEEAADDADPDPLAGSWASGERRPSALRRHDAAQQRSVRLLKRAVVLALIGQVKRMGRANDVGECQFLRDCGQSRRAKRGAGRRIRFATPPPPQCPGR
ncbi:MAG: hypothetical protein WDN49_12085 [Acetobacteraceae bacterium]